MKRLSRNDIVLASCVATVVAMVGLTYAAVPLYYIFCAATGYNGTPSRAKEAINDVRDRVITVRFDTNVDPGLLWSFEPVQRMVDVKVGETTLVYFRARNDDNIPVTGHAAFNVAPDKAAVYFSKVQCFCFTEQRLEPGQTIEMPVTFFIDPAILKNRDANDVSQMALSYTFYPSIVPKTAAVTPPGVGG